MKKQVRKTAFRQSLAMCLDTLSNVDGQRVVGHHTSYPHVTGDLVLETNFLNGELLEGLRTGDLFILEKIDNKQKNIGGKLFFANRTQTVAIEVLASNARHDKKHSASQPGHRPRKGKSA